MAVLQSLINRLGKGRGKKEKNYNTGYSYLVTQPSTNPTQQGLTLLSGRSMLLSLWYSSSTLNAFLKFLRWEKVSKREKNLWYCMAGKVENKKIEEYENGNNYLLWWSDKRRFPYTRTDNFVNVNVFNSVTSPRVLSFRCILHYFLTMPVGFN